MSGVDSLAIFSGGLGLEKLDERQRHALRWRRADGLIRRRARLESGGEGSSKNKCKERRLHRREERVSSW